MRNGEGFLIMYSITSRLSFDEIDGLHQQICRVKDKERFPMVLIANKCDLESERQVTTQEGKDLALRFGCHFIESSAKFRINVDEAFYEVVRDIRRFNKEQELRSNSQRQSALPTHTKARKEDVTSKCCTLM